MCFRAGMHDSSARAPGGGQGSPNESLNPTNTSRTTLMYSISTIQYGRKELNQHKLFFTYVD